MNRKQRRSAAAVRDRAQPSAHDGFAAAVSLHRAGSLDAAETAYRRHLEAAPDDARALHLLGVVQLQRGDAAAACVSIGRALTLRDDMADAHDNLGSALRAAGRPEEAAVAHRRAIARDSSSFKAHYNLGNALLDAGVPLSAVDAFRHALAIQPDYAQARYNLANTLRDQGEAAAAAAEYRILLTAHADWAEAWNNLGGVVGGLGELVEAEAAYRRALLLRPDHADTLVNLGNVLKETGRFQEAEACHRQAVSLAPGSADAWFALGVALQAQDRLEPALDAYRTGLQLAPDDPKGLTNMAAALELVGRVSEAVDLLRRVLDRDPGFAEAHGNMALCWMAQRRIADAEASLDTAIACDPGLAQAHMTRALLRLEQGRLATGWEDYAWRFSAGQAQPDRRFAIPRWRGEPLPGGSLLIWREQGVGDELMFATQYARVMDPNSPVAVGSVEIQCDPRLAGLFGRAFPRARVTPEPPPAHRADGSSIEHPAATAEIPAGDLPKALGATLPALAGRPYLTPEPGLAARWAERLAALPPGLRLGVCWRSGLVTTRRRSSYATLGAWRPILSLPGLTLVSLQYAADAAEEIPILEAGIGRPIHRWDDLDLYSDLEGVAALMSGLDLVVTAPTAIGELAGALGVPVWRVAPVGDWSTLGTDVRPWFPTMRVFTAHNGGLEAALADAARALARLVG